MHINVSSPNDAQNLSNLLKNGNWMVLYHADWCGHCQTIKPEWKKVVDKISNNSKPSFNIAEIESSHIGSLINSPKVSGFPTIKMFNSGKEVANFEDERNAENIEQFGIVNSKKYKNKGKSHKGKSHKGKSHKGKSHKGKSHKTKSYKTKSNK